MARRERNQDILVLRESQFSVREGPWKRKYKVSCHSKNRSVSLPRQQGSPGEDTETRSAVCRFQKVVYPSILIALNWNHKTVFQSQGSALGLQSSRPSLSCPQPYHFPRIFWPETRNNIFKFIQQILGAFLLVKHCHILGFIVVSKIRSLYKPHEA